MAGLGLSGCRETQHAGLRLELSLGWIRGASSLKADSAHNTRRRLKQTLRHSGEADYPSLSMSSHAPEPTGDGVARARVFQGGTYLDLHKMLGVSSGSQVLPLNPVICASEEPIATRHQQQQIVSSQYLVHPRL